MVQARLTRKQSSHDPSDTVFAVLDVETTGTDPATHRIVEVAVVLVTGRGAVVDEFATLVAAPGGVKDSTRFHGITDADLQDAPTWRQVWPELSALLEGAVMVAHNLPFDLGFLTAETRRIKGRMPNMLAVCTLESAQEQLNGQAFSLTSLHKTVSGGWRNDGHSALGDARATRDLLMWLLHEGPVPLRLTKPVPVWQGADATPATPVKIRPVERWVRDLRVVVNSVPDSPRSRMTDVGADARTEFTDELREALSDGRLFSDELEMLAARALGLRASKQELLGLIEPVWSETMASRAGRSQTEDKRVRRTATQLGLDGVVQVPEVAEAEDAGPYARILTDWRVAFVGDSTELEELRGLALAHGVREAKRVTETVRVTVLDPGAQENRKVERSRELGIDVVDPAAFRPMLEKAIRFGRTREDKRLAEQEASDAYWEAQREEADAYWRHTWKR
ncbi:3'-5' exonuclease [Kytococcus schroeteri]|uniref:3'-5' exonuclease n=1 Tax=Kytococcus schroeteri TaxID=138300 RepID=UPI0015E8D5DE|nr:3'-5' exonuclease [Kytococcus schroeteri]